MSPARGTQGRWQGSSAHLWGGWGRGASPSGTLATSFDPSLVDDKLPAMPPNPHAPNLSTHRPCIILPTLPNHPAPTNHPPTGDASIAHPYSGSQPPPPPRPHTPPSMPKASPNSPREAAGPDRGPDSSCQTGRAGEHTWTRARSWDLARRIYGGRRRRGGGGGGGKEGGDQRLTPHAAPVERVCMTQAGQSA